MGIRFFMINPEALRTRINKKLKHRERSLNFLKNNPEYMANYHKNNLEKYKEIAKEWYKNNLEKATEHNRNCYKNIRLIAFQIISNLEIPKCSNCACEYLPMLEINHKNGGGNIEGLRGINLYVKIINGKRKTDDLEVTCKVCNIIHYVKLKFGASYDIKFNGVFGL